MDLIRSIHQDGLREGRENALKVFKKAAKNCAAYKSFLTHCQISPNAVISIDQAPVTDKNNYLKQYTLDKRLYSGSSVSDFYLICSSSGSTDDPTLWPRSFDYDKDLEVLHTNFLNDHFDVMHKKTLIIIGFGLGTTQAGLMHLKASWEGSVRGKMSVISPNANAEITVYMLQDLYKYYDQTICIGYPPIITDFVDLGIKNGLNVKKWNLKIAYASESVSVKWRKHTAEKLGIQLTDIISFYGSTEAGMIGFETPVINKLINKCISDEDLRTSLFGTSSIPTLVDVNMNKKFIELKNNEILITVDQPVPLIRYNSHDTGNFLHTSYVDEVLKKHGYPKSGLDPGVFILAIYGRNINNIYAMEDIRLTLEEYIYDGIIDKEFQFSERIESNVINIILRCYTEKSGNFPYRLKKALLHDVKSGLLKLNKHKPGMKIRPSLSVRNSKFKKGYIYGKTRYLFNEV